MATIKIKHPIEYEVGLKNRKLEIIWADTLKIGDYGVPAVVKFILKGEIVMVLAPQKWDYIKRLTPVS